MEKKTTFKLVWPSVMDLKNKNLFLSFVFFLICSLAGFSQTIQVRGITPNPVCAGATVTVNFDATNGTGGPNRFTKTTVFTVYLSSNTGGAPYTSIGTLTLLPYTFLTGNGAVNVNVQGTIALPISASGTYKISLSSTGPTFDGSTGIGASPNFTVNASPVGGLISGGATVCPGTNSTPLTLSGYTGTIVKWQSSPVSDFLSGVIDIANTTANYVATNLNATTYYRAVVTNGTCDTNSASATVTVNPSPGIVSANQSICSGTQPANIILTGSNGTIQWQSSTDNISFSNITGATAATLTSAQMGTLIQTTYYRAVVTGGCGTVNSASVTVTVSPASVGGTVNSDATVCSGTNSTVLTLTGHTGNVIRWESSPNAGFSSPTTIANTTNTLTVNNLVATTHYRAVVQSGGCNTANSSSVKITVNTIPTGGTISGSTAVCFGTNSTLLTLTGYTNTIQQWQSSTVSDFSSNVTNIANTFATYTATNLTVTTYYRAVLVNMTCTAYSTVATITVNPLPTASISGSNGPICSGSDATFTLTGTSGATVTYTINGGSNQNIVLTGGTAIVTITGAVINQTLDLVSVDLSGCSQILSGSATVVVDAVNTWTGAVDSNWNTSGNWSCNAVPTSNSDVVINSGTVVVSGAAALANTIALNGTSTLTVNSGNNLTVTNAVNTAGGAVFALQNNANLIQVNNVANSGNIVVNRESSALLRQDYTLWASPVASQNLLAFSPQTLTTRFYVYNPATNVYSAIAPGSNSFQLGKGYLIRMPDNWSSTTATKWNGRYTGVPNNGNITLNLSNGGAGFGYNAIGNPYPSPVDMVSFVNANSTNITGTLYFWRKTNNAATDPGYCTWTTAGFVGNGEAQVFDPNGILRTGQGFIVELTNGQTTVDFNNTMRTADNGNQFFRAVSQNAVLTGDRIWLNVANTTGSHSQMLLGYFSNATSGVDYGIDGKALGNPTVSLTSLLNSADYVIQGRAAFDQADVVPLSFKTATTGQHTISINQLDGLFLGSQTIYLKDNLTSTIHDLKAGSYVFNSNSGSYPSRFEIVYQNALLNTHNNTFNESSVIVYKENNVVLVKANGFVLDTVKVFDVSGRLLNEKKNISSTETNLQLKEGNGILLIQVTTEQGETVTKKITY
jgi:hypothetical protein